MNHRFYVSKNNKTFASVTARTPDEAIQIACRQTGRSTEHCTANHAYEGRAEDSRPGANHYIVADEHGPFAIVIATNHGEAVTRACEATGLEREECSVQRIDLVLGKTRRATL